MTMNRGNLATQLWPGIRSFWGLEPDWEAHYAAEKLARIKDRARARAVRKSKREFDPKMRLRRRLQRIRELRWYPEVHELVRYARDLRSPKKRPQPDPLAAYRELRTAWEAEEQRKSELGFDPQIMKNLAYERYAQGWTDPDQLQPKPERVTSEFRLGEGIHALGFILTRNKEAEKADQQWRDLFDVTPRQPDKRDMNAWLKRRRAWFMHLRPDKP